jgi:hypothetical protein
MHDLDVGLNSETLIGLIRGPLWRRSAFRSAMGGWRDFALRNRLRKTGPAGRVTPGITGFCGADAGSARTKG